MSIVTDRIYEDASGVAACASCPAAVAKSYLVEALGSTLDSRCWCDHRERRGAHPARQPSRQTHARPAIADRLARRMPRCIACRSDQRVANSDRNRADRECSYRCRRHRRPPRRQRNDRRYCTRPAARQCSLACYPSRTHANCRSLCGAGDSIALNRYSNGRTCLQPHACRGPARGTAYLRRKSHRGGQRTRDRGSHRANAPQPHLHQDRGVAAN